MREPLVPASRESGGVRGVPWQRASAAVGVRVGERALFHRVRGGCPAARRQEEKTLFGDKGGESSVARRPEETLCLETGEEDSSVAK